jgi:hypothetical protein
MVAICKTCHKEYKTFPAYIARRPNGGYCSQACRPHVVLKCLQCGIDIHTNESHSKYCSDKCKEQYILNRNIKSFMNHLDKVDDCWIWKGPFSEQKQDIPEFRARGIDNNNARVASFRLFVNSNYIPSREIWLTTSCGNLKCVAPKHLILMTPTEIIELRDKSHYYSE